MGCFLVQEQLPLFLKMLSSSNSPPIICFLSTKPDWGCLRRTNLLASLWGAKGVSLNDYWVPYSTFSYKEGSPELLQILKVISYRHVYVCTWKCTEYLWKLHLTIKRWFEKKGTETLSALRAWRHWDSMLHESALLTVRGGRERLFKRRPYQTATQTSCGFSQMDVMLQLLMQDLRLSQVEDRTSQNLHNCENLTAPLLSVIIMSLLTVEGKERYTEWLSNRQTACQWIPDDVMQVQTNPMSEE